MPNFPAIQYLDAATFMEESENPSIEPAKMEGGYVITRPRFTRRPRRSFSFNFTLMNDVNKTTLFNFWNTVRGGSNAFTWTHPQTGEAINVRFSPQTTMRFKRIGFGANSFWQTETITLVEV